MSLTKEQVEAMVRSVLVTQETLHTIEPKSVRKRLALHCADVLTIAHAYTDLRRRCSEAVR